MASLSLSEILAPSSVGFFLAAVFLTAQGKGAAMSRCLYVCAVTLLIARQGFAELIVDDFRTGLFSISTSEPYETISSIDDLTGVLATQRHASAGDNGSGETTISLGEDSILRFSTDGAETLGVSWQGFAIDVTQRETRVLMLDFVDFHTPEHNLDGAMWVSLRNPGTPYPQFLDVARLSFSDLVGGALIPVELDIDVPSGDTFDLTGVDAIHVSTLSASPGTSFGLRAVRLIPEPTAFVLLATGVCFVLFARRLR